MVHLFYTKDQCCLIFEHPVVFMNYVLGPHPSPCSNPVQTNVIWLHCPHIDANVIERGV